MSDDPQGLAARVAKDREVLLRLLSVTASLAGLCIAALGFLEATARRGLGDTYADELIAIDALLFVLCVYLILWALRTRSLTRARMLSRLVDVVFLFALTTLLAASTYIVYWII
jgi:multisubunit Na+/H+ antiporter MnhF subunit